MLTQLPERRRLLILHCTLLLLLSLESYSAYTRVFMLHLTTSLFAKVNVLEGEELRVARELSFAIRHVTSDDLAAIRQEKHARHSRRGRLPQCSAAQPIHVPLGPRFGRLNISGLGSVAGGGPFGGGIGGEATASLLGRISEGPLVVGCIFGISGARLVVKPIEQYSKDMDCFRLVPVHGELRASEEPRSVYDVPLPERRLRLALCFTGWTSSETALSDPWKVLDRGQEALALRWDIEGLMRTSVAMETVTKSAAWAEAKKEFFPKNGKFIQSTPWLLLPAIRPESNVGPCTSSVEPSSRPLAPWPDQDQQGHR